MATEEARAHRRSDEYERTEDPPDIAKDENLNGYVKEGFTREESGHLPTKEVSIVFLTEIVGCYSHRPRFLIPAVSQTPP